MAVVYGLEMNLSQPIHRLLVTLLLVKMEEYQKNQYELDSR